MFFFFLVALLLSSFWTKPVVTGVVPSPPPVFAFKYYRAEGSAIPLLVDFSSSVAYSRSRAFRKSICAQEKVSTNIYTSMHLVGLELAKLTCTRLEDNLIRHRGDRFMYNAVARKDTHEQNACKK